MNFSSHFSRWNILRMALMAFALGLLVWIAVTLISREPVATDLNVKREMTDIDDGIRGKLIGAVWFYGRNDGWREVYGFGSDGSLEETIISPDGYASARLMHWVIANGRLVFSGYSDIVRHDYLKIYFNDDAMYLMKSDGGIDKFNRISGVNPARSEPPKPKP